MLSFMDTLIHGQQKYPAISSNETPEQRASELMGAGHHAQGMSALPSKSCDPHTSAVSMFTVQLV